MNEIGLNSKRIINFKNSPEISNPQTPQTNAVNVENSQTIELPEIYRHSYTEPTTAKDTIKKYDMMGIISPWFEHPLMMLATCVGLSFGVDKFSAACGGEYEKSLVGKAAKFGDKIENSKFANSKPIQSVINLFKKGGNYLKEKTKNSDLINAIVKTPSQPEWEIVKGETLNMQQHVAQDFSQVARKLKLTQEGFVKLSDLYIKKEDEAFLKNLFSGNKFTEEMASNAIQLKRIGITDSEILNIVKSADATNLVKAKQLEKLGITADFIKKIEKNTPNKADVKKIMEACQKAKDIKIGEGHYSWLGKLQIFERKIGLDEIGNRLASMSKSEVSTKTGRAMATFVQKCHRGFTFGGGKLGVLLFVAPTLVETMLNVKKAEPNQKIGTAVQGIVSAASWVFTFPIGLSIMHHLAGAQYAGMSQLNVAKYRKLISDFNAKVDNKFFKDKEAYDKAYDVLEAQLKALKGNKPQNLLTKICKKLGSFVTMDLETIKPYNGSNFVMNTARKARNFLKNVGGIPMRFAIWGGITMGVLETILNKSIKTCFGNYYDGFKEEEHIENKKAQKEFTKEDLRTRLLAAQEEKIYGKQSQDKAALLENNPETVKQYATEKPDEKELNPVQNTTDNKSEEKAHNLPQEEKHEAQASKIDSNTYIPSQNSGIKKAAKPMKQDNYTYIPSSENIIKNSSTETINKYIPSQIGAKFSKTFDNSGLEQALKRADRAEQKAIQILNGNFNAI